MRELLNELRNLPEGMAQQRISNEREQIRRSGPSNPDNLDVIKAKLEGDRALVPIDHHMIETYFVVFPELFNVLKRMGKKFYKQKELAGEQETDEEFD